MYLKDIVATDFRNLSADLIEFESGVNIISGDNAAGKSSVLESITLLLTGRSFRTNKLATIVKRNNTAFTVFSTLSSKKRVGVGYNVLTKAKKIKVDGREVSSLSDIASIYPVQLLCPESYHLIDSGPIERRKYLDWLLFHVEHSYQKHWQLFNKALKQRNEYLKTHSDRPDISVLDSWDSLICQHSKIIDESRKSLVERLLPLINKTARFFENDCFEQLCISYYPGYSGCLAEKLRESRKRDLALGNTQYGPHKADLRIKIGKMLAKDLLSRGQKKVLINSLFLAQTQYLKDVTSKESLFLIDDFSSELDEFNQGQLLRALGKQKDIQIIITCLHPSMIKPLIKGYNNVKMFHVEHGKVNAVPSADLLN